MKRRVSLLILSAAVMIGSGCASIMNPYSENFSCEGNGDNGKCGHVYSHYVESKSHNMQTQLEPPAALSPALSGGVTSPKISESEVLYRDAYYQKTASILKAPVTPLAEPPKAARVTFFSYTGDDDVLFMPRVAYYFKTKPKWIMGDYLNKEKE